MGAMARTAAMASHVTVLNEAPFSCPAGGVTYEVEGSGEENEVCNGKDGTFSTEPLPEGEVLKGTWSAGPIVAGAPEQAIPFSFSFSIPTAAGISNEQAIYMIEGEEKNPHFGFEFPEGSGEEIKYCEGGAANPIPLKNGYLCIFADKEVNWNMPRGRSSPAT